MSTDLEPHSRSNWIVQFFAIWTGQAFSLLGSQLVQFALIWWLTKSTGSATVLATASLIGLLPQVFLGPIAGTLVDRWNRRLTMIVADGIIALATLVLAVLFLNHWVQIWHVYLLLFVRSAAGSFHWPAMQASTGLIVPKEHLSRIQGINQALNGGMNIASAPLGALLLSTLSMHWILAIDIGTAILAIVPLCFVAIPQPDRTAAQQNGEKTSVGQEFRAGLAYVWSWPGLVLILLMATLINLLLTPGFSLMPLLVTKYYGGEAIQLASMESSWGIGIILGGLLLGVWGGFRRRMWTSMLGLVLIGASSLLIGLLPPSAFAWAVFGMFISGLSNPITNGPLFAVIQSVVEPSMQGRVLTLIGSVAAAMSPLGLIIAGPVADALGVNTWFIIGGVSTALLAVVAVFTPAIMHVEDGPPASKKASADKPVDEVIAISPQPGD